MRTDDIAARRAGPQGIGLDGPLAQRHRARLVGSGPDIVVFSHGLGTDQTAWHAAIEDLPARYTALLFDLPGAGPLLPADFDPSRYRSLAPFADDVLALLDEIGVKRCRFVGHSVSSMIGALVAIEAPELFEKLVMLNASPRYLNDTGYVGGFEPQDLEQLFAAMTANYQGWVAGFAPMAVGAGVPGAVQDFSAGLLAMRPDITATIARMIFETDLRAILPRITPPTVLVHAHGDIAVPEPVAHYLHRGIAGSALVWIDATGHLPHLSAPAEVAEVLHDHLA